MSNLKTLNGTAVSQLCFGCMQFGGMADIDASRSMFETCREAEVNFFDTAHVYTGGLSEHLLGSFLKNDREQIIIATKTAYTGGSGRANIIQMFDESRARLDLDVIDILYLHRWDSETPLEETFATLTQLQQTGKIRYIGVSNYSAWQVMKAQAVAHSLGTKIDVIQPMYSLVKRQAEVELFPMAQAEKTAVASYSPLGSGLLTGKYQKGGSGRLASDTRYAARYGQGWMYDVAKALGDVAEDMGTNPATLAVAWAAQHPAVTAPIISARNVKQLLPSLDGAKILLSPQDYARIEALSPRPAPATDRLEEAFG